MTRLSWLVLGASLGGLTLAATVVAYAAAPPPTAPPANPPVGVPDRGKFGIERPATNVVANSAPAQPGADGFVNPKVEPGKVKWHATFAEACAASAKSGKPVMLFQMMGKLDDQFC
jgi:hypothetical protein